MDSERKKITKAHPMTDMEEIDKFIKEKWGGMTELERQECLRVDKLKREEDLMRLLKKNSKGNPAK